jgi:hypothetical protein
MNMFGAMTPVRNEASERQPPRARGRILDMILDRILTFYKAGFLTYGNALT